MTGIGIKTSVGLLLVTGIGSSGFLILKGNNPKNLGEKLSNEGIIVLNTDPDSHIHKEEWEKIVQKYEGNENRIEGFTISTFSKNTQDRSENIKKLKQKCEDLFNSPIQKNEEFVKKEELAKNWCILESVKKQTNHVVE